jgi:succinate dehydrogenase hydrophobic anchor subunit
MKAYEDARRRFESICVFLARLCGKSSRRNHAYTFFFERFTGLSITILCILTLFVVMQFTGRVDWDTLFRRGARAEPLVNTRHEF